MATSVSHAMRRYPTTPPESKYNNFNPTTSEESSISHQWSSTGRSVEENVGGSALSRSMRYAEPWLYGSVRAAPGGLVLAYPAPAIVLCACSDYTSGTAKTNKKGPTQCKKCKGTRLPLAQGGTVRTKYGTVRGYPTSTPALTTVRAGTVRVSSSSRPSILPTVDPYDLMRRSRLTCPENGAQFRARSSSPNKTRGQRTPTKIRPRSPSPLNLSIGRKSILECNVNPYELMSSNDNDQNSQKTKIKTPDVDYEDVDISNNKKVSHIPIKLRQQHKPRSTRRHSTINNNERESGNKFKSILKKPTTTFNDTENIGSVIEASVKTAGCKSGSHFYLPMPNASRKKVQFLVENELNQSLNNEVQAEQKTEQTDGKDESESPLTDTDTDSDEPCRLKRSLSERLNQGLPVISTTFNDTMALRSRNRPALSEGGAALFDSITDLQRLDGVGPTRPRPREPPPPPPPPSGQEDRPATPPPRPATESESGYDVAFKDNKKNELSNKPIENGFNSPPETPPPVVPPRKRSNSRTPPIHKNEHTPTHKNNPKHSQHHQNGSNQNHQDENHLQSNGIQSKPYETINRSTKPTNTPSTKTTNASSTKPTDTSSIKPTDTSSPKPTDFSSPKPTDTSVKSIDTSMNGFSSKEMDSSKVKINESTEEKVISSFNNKYSSINYQSFRIEAEDIKPTIENISITSPISNIPIVKVEPTKTIVRINSPSPTVHRLQIRNEYPDSNIQSVSISESPQRKTSIMINGDECYSTVNVNDDVPIYQSSVVVNDCSDSNKQNCEGKSSVYITGDFQSNSSSTSLSSLSNEDASKKTLVIFDNNSFTSTSSISSGSSTPEFPSKTFVHLQKETEPMTQNKREAIPLPTAEKQNVPLEKPSSEELQRLLKDPVEAVKRNLVPHVCGKADVDRRPARNKDKKLNSTTPSNTLVARLLEDPFLGSLAEGLETDTVAKLIEDSLLKLRNQENSPDDDKDISSENESCPPYELMEAGSDCYSNHSNRSSVTEDELSTRSKFYQLLADAALTEVEEHHYESIRPNVDPIYEEIEIPPPLPANPPPSSLIDDLQIDKQFTTRSIFEGASKYDILSYLVDAKERGIIPEESYTYNFNNSGEVIVEEEEESKVRESVFSSRVSHMSTVSDSSEDSSLVMTGEKNSHQKSAEIERNDSGVGSETSKCSRSRYLNQPEAAVTCEDCELPVDPAPEDGPLICRKCSKKRSERKEIITEIVETEEKYSRDLQIILEEFYQPMLVAGLLTPEQLSAIFLNVEELLENSQALAERLRDTLEIAVEQGDEDLLTVNIGKIILEAAPMLHAFESYCVRQGAASLLLASLEKDKELLRIFLRVSQMENTMLRRMNLNSFLMVPVQRVTKYPLLLARLYKVTPIHHNSRELLREAQHKIELHLNHMNSETRDVPSKLWRRISSGSGRRSSSEMDLVNIKLRKIAVDVLEWNHDEARFALEGRLLFTQPTDNNWRKGRTIKLSPVNAMLVTNGKPGTTNRPDRTTEDGSLAFPRQNGIREAALLLVRDKGGRYSLLREPLYLDRCVIATDPAWQSYFEVQELLGKDTFIFKAEDPEMTRTWYRQLQYHAQGMGAWRKRRNALANIMINGMGSRT